MEDSATVEQLIAELKRYVDLRMQHLKIIGTEKLSYILAALIFIVLAAIFGIMAICYFSLSLVYLLRIYVGIIGAYAIMGAVALVVVLLLYMLRKQWLLNPIVRLLARNMIDNEQNQDNIEEL